MTETISINRETKPLDREQIEEGRALSLDFKNSEKSQTAKAMSCQLLHKMRTLRTLRYRIC